MDMDVQASKVRIGDAALSLFCVQIPRSQDAVISSKWCPGNRPALEGQ